MARLWRRMAALQRLAIAGYRASSHLAPHRHKRTVHPIQLIFSGSILRKKVDSGFDKSKNLEIT
jgi:hypothetical protein